MALTAKQQVTEEEERVDQDKYQPDDDNHAPTS